MNQLADKLTLYIIKCKLITEDDYEMYKYGMLTGLELIICVFISALISICMGEFLEFVILTAVFFSLRAYVGGIHMRNFSTCLICSCSVICVLLELANTFVLNPIVSVLVTFFNLVIINRLAPYATEEYINDQKEERYFALQRNKILFVVFVVDIIFLFLGLKTFLSLLLYASFTIIISMALGIIFKNNK